MTNNSLIKAKAWYEEQLQTKLATALNVEKSKINVEWAVTGFKTVIDLSAAELITRYTLTLNNGNLTFDAIAYKQCFTEPNDEGQRMLTGIQAKNVVIDLNTMSALMQMMYEVLQSEYADEETVSTPMATDYIDAATEPEGPATPVMPAIPEMPVVPDEMYDGNN